MTTLDNEVVEALERLQSEGFRLVVSPIDWRDAAKRQSAGAGVNDWCVWVDLLHVDSTEPTEGYAGGSTIEQAILNAVARFKVEG